MGATPLLTKMISFVIGSFGCKITKLSLASERSVRSLPTQKVVDRASFQLSNGVQVDGTNVNGSPLSNFLVGSR